MASAKPTISLDPVLRDAADAAARAKGVSFSAYVAEALRRQVNADGLLAVIAEWEATHGVITPEEIAASRVTALLAEEATTAAAKAPRRAKAKQAKAPARRSA